MAVYNVAVRAFLTVVVEADSVAHATDLAIDVMDAASGWIAPDAELHTWDVLDAELAR